jgi:predicted thioesterase
VAAVATEVHEHEFVAERFLLTDVRGTLPRRVLSTPAMIGTMEVRDGERTIGVGTHERRGVGGAGA